MKMNKNGACLWTSVLRFDEIQPLTYWESSGLVLTSRRDYFTFFLLGCRRWCAGIPPPPQKKNPHLFSVAGVIVSEENDFEPFSFRRSCYAIGVFYSLVTGFSYLNCVMPASAGQRALGQEKLLLYHR